MKKSLALPASVVFATALSSCDSCEIPQETQSVDTVRSAIQDVNKLCKTAIEKDDVINYWNVPSRGFSADFMEPDLGFPERSLANGWINLCDCETEEYTNFDSPFPDSPEPAGTWQTCRAEGKGYEIVVGKKEEQKGVYFVRSAQMAAKSVQNSVEREKKFTNVRSASLYLEGESPAELAKFFDETVQALLDQVSAKKQAQRKPDSDSDFVAVDVSGSDAGVEDGGVDDRLEKDEIPLQPGE